MATRPQANQLQTNAIGLIGTALWVSVLAFGAVIWFVHRIRPNTFPPQPMALRYASLAASVLSVVVVLAMRGGVKAMNDGPERNSKVLMLWAFGEAPALFGGVLFLLTSEAQWYALGLLAMLTAYVLVPLRRPT